MRRKLLLCAALALLILPAKAAAHVMETQQSIGAVLHITPADDPIAGELVSFSFEFKDLHNAFQPSNCDCELKILKDGQEILSREAALGGSTKESSIDTGVYTFPDKGEYQVVISGKPRPGTASFSAFNLTYDIRVNHRAEYIPFSQQAIQEISTRIHIGVGSLLLALIVLRKLETFGVVRGGWVRYSRAVFSTTIGLWIILSILFARGFNEAWNTWQLLNGDRQSVHHLLMGLFLTIAGIVEYLRTLKRYENQKWLSIFTPAAVWLVGFLFAIHPQHGSAEAVASLLLYHRILAAVLMGSSTVRLIQIYLRRANKAPKIAFVFGYIWLLGGIVAAIMLISFREPPGAYENFRPGGQTLTTTNP